MKKIAIELTWLRDQYYQRGIGRYGIEMVRRIIAQQSVEHFDLVIIGFGSLRENLEILGINEDPKNIEFHTLGEIHLSTPWYNIFKYKPKLNEIIAVSKPDIFWAMHFDRPVPTHMANCVVTAHDIIPIVTGEYSRQGYLLNKIKGLYYRQMWSRVKKAKLVLTSSEFSRKELLRYGGLNNNQVHVVYLGISENFVNYKENKELLSDTLTNFGLRKNNMTLPYLIYDSGMEPNKNPQKLIEIFSKLNTKINNLRLVLVGGDFKTNMQPETIGGKYAASIANKFGVTKSIITTGRISDNDLIQLTAGALSYINLSNYEGFGLGPLQAMAVGTPVILANRSCFPEISGDAALMIEPENTVEASAHIIELLNSESKIDELIEKGYAHSRKFSWDNTFKKIWRLISTNFND